jgi:hypothetical protein
MFIPDPDFFYIPDPGPRVKKAPDPGTGSGILIDTIHRSTNYLPTLEIV